MASFYGRGSTAWRLESLRGGSLLFNTKSPEIPSTHFINLGRMKGWVNLAATQWFWTRDPWTENQRLNHYTTVLRFHKSHGKKGKNILKWEYLKEGIIYEGRGGGVIPRRYPLQSSYACNFHHTIFPTCT